MNRFLNREQVESAIKSLLKNSNGARIAMAYWGGGAVSRLLADMPPKKDVVIVCDLLSGGCNPKEIAKLQARIGKDKVLKREKLHAKVWLTDRGAILGSSNASTNGVGLEGDKKTKGLVEANIQTNDLIILKNLQKWFNEQVLNGATTISQDDLKRAEVAWHARIGRSWPPPPKTQRRPVYLVCYDDKTPSAAAHAVHKDMERETGTRLGSYEDWPEIPAGADLLDFYVRPRSVKYTGCWQTFDPQLTRKTKGGGTVTFCRRNRDDALGSELMKISDWEVKVRNIFEHHRGRVLRCEKPLGEFLSEYS